MSNAKVKTSQNDYPYVRMWHKLSGSYQYYITAQIELARKDGAPQTAIYKRSPAPHQREEWEALKDQASLWASINPTVEEYTFSSTVLNRVEEELGLSYKDVLTWEILQQKEQPTGEKT